MVISNYGVRNNPNPAVEHRQARMEEEQFFSPVPWIKVLAPFGPFQLRLGTRNLQNALSQLLELKTTIAACLEGGTTGMQMLNIGLPMTSYQLSNVPSLSYGCLLTEKT
ncbi:hypothetical protein TSTA_065340 [Talaromyces stipitatus ATCC 10500]|uniref:Uncharacterized protein n=1 Tax=Talaromyces stipitatus (strain ATCC 10500 / CBS 375.48 / QM 6759 / NRRL 1006) TaxID=441959 RepID=B8LTK0_TALSN|nr:uncharacterized protein TSTA_065340 [Talaromyces stipitatus ATCC 10500]EED23078.1 hypothetical protein TSTA_065340 [Talaromyces stipitatus ATCC 10500]